MRYLTRYAWVLTATIRYCSRDCQKKHWKHHKEDCKRLTRADSGPDANTFYNNLAHSALEAVALASTLNITLPEGRGSMKGIMHAYLAQLTPNHVLTNA